LAEHHHVRIDQRGAAGVLALNRPRRANAYTEAALNELSARLTALIADDAVRVVVVTGAKPGTFCAGADLDEVRARTVKDALALTSRRVFDEIAACPKPTLAAIDGPAVGGGFELALACDARIATPRARFAFPETALGILPAAGGTWRLPRIAGDSLAREMILFGRELDAASALAAGVVGAIAEPDALWPTIDAWVDRAGRCDAAALALAKRALDLADDNRGAREFTRAAQGLLYALRVPGKGRR
jgi:enoyl-CoA hydratase